MQAQMQQLLRQGGAGGGDGPGPEFDTAETIYISSLALLKIVKHGRAGVPVEVMGLMLGEVIDDYTISVTDVFAMPQVGTGVSVEAVDPVFQSNMLEMLKQTGRPEQVVGWYHSHPGWGCWLSSVDVNTQRSFEQLSKRAVAVVVDPVQSVRGNVEIDAFRLIGMQTMMTGQEPRQVTSVLGHLKKPTVKALIHGLNTQYYQMPISFRKSTLEEHMLLNLKKSSWTDGLNLQDSSKLAKKNEETIQEMVSLAKDYGTRILEEATIRKAGDADKLGVKMTGKIDPRKGLERCVDKVMNDNISQILGTMTNSVCF